MVSQAQARPSKTPSQCQPLARGHIHQAQHRVLQLDGVQTRLPVGHSRVHVQPVGGGSVGRGSPQGPSPTPATGAPHLPAILGSQPHGGQGTAAGPLGVSTGLLLGLRTTQVGLWPIFTAGRMMAPEKPMQAHPCHLHQPFPQPFPPLSLPLWESPPARLCAWGWGRGRVSEDVFCEGPRPHCSCLCLTGPRVRDLCGLCGLLRGLRWVDLPIGDSSHLPCGSKR